jgi:hypothetical protein
MGTRTLSTCWGVKAYESPLSSAEAKNAWSFITTPQYAFMAWYLSSGYVFVVWYLVKQRGSFTFTLPVFIISLQYI